MNDIVAEVLQHTNWDMLKQQKLSLLHTISYLEDNLTEQGDSPDITAAQVEDLTGILHWIDALQDAACAEGYPVRFLTEDSDSDA